MKYLISLVIFLAGCSIHLQIDTEIAAQDGSGEISEGVASNDTTDITPTVDVKADTGGL